MTSLSSGQGPWADAASRATDIPLWASVSPCVKWFTMQMAMQITVVACQSRGASGASRGQWVALGSPTLGAGGCGVPQTLILCSWGYSCSPLCTVQGSKPFVGRGTYDCLHSWNPRRSVAHSMIEGLSRATQISNAAAPLRCSAEPTHGLPPAQAGVLLFFNLVLILKFTFHLPVVQPSKRCVKSSPPQRQDSLSHPCPFTPTLTD